VQLFVALITPGLGVGLGIEALKVLLRGLVPQLLLRRGSIGVGDLLLAGPLQRGGVIPRGLLAPLADTLRELQDLATFGGAVTGSRMNRA
jgi:hypothetical protein